MGSPRDPPDWIPLSTAPTTSPARDPLPLSPRTLNRPGFPFYATTTTSPSASPASPISSAFNHRLGTPALDGGRGLLHRSPGLGTRGVGGSEGQRPPNVRRRSFTNVLPERGELERLPSLTSVMEGRRGSLSKERQDTYDLFWLWSTRFALLLAILLVLLLTVRHLGPRSWSQSLPSLPSVLPALATIPYPTSSHPRTPSPGDRTPFADFLTTRLGSHFSLPSLDAPSHLWLTTATEASLHFGARHLREFVRGLDGVDARRKLVVLCLDEGCMESCRRADWLCFGGFIGTERDLALVEEVKLRGAAEALESGRMVFLVDDGVYFRRDPLPDMGDLHRFDIQLPHDWSSADPHAGFVLFSPTARIISLLNRLLFIHTSGTERLWSTTNLLLDPDGVARGYKKVAPVLPLVPGAAVRKPEVERVEVGYGQSEFESAWGGGVDVRVLDPRRFRKSVGAPKEGEGSEALYLHCVCCGDPAATDYIASSLGFHAPSLIYPSTTASGIPLFPQILTLPSLPSPALLPLLLQLSHDSNRSFLPPPSSPLPPSLPSPPILPPNYLITSLAHLGTFPPSADLARAATGLQETLWLDFAAHESYAALLVALQEPFFRDTMVVTLENLEERGWEVREEFEVGVERGGEVSGGCKEMLGRPGREEERWAEGERDRIVAKKMESGGE